LPDFAVLFANELNRDLLPDEVKRLLAKARFHSDSRAYYQHLLDLFSEQHQTSTDLPMARLRGGSTFSLCADPCYLHPDRDKLLLFYRDLEITLEESLALADYLQPLFEDLQATLIVKSPEQWLVEINTPVEVDFSAKQGLHGLPITDFMPQGKDAEHWIRLANEIQMLLFDCPVNQAREATGKVPINNLWFWGKAEFPQNWSAWKHVSGDDDLLQRLAIESGSDYQSDTQRLLDIAEEEALHVVTFDPAQDWQQQLQTLSKNWLQPASSALTKWQLNQLNLIVPEWGIYRLTPISSWQFWR